MNLNRLIAPFEDSELEWKPQSVGIKNGQPWAMILCYVQARAIQSRLDEVFGPMNWRDEYRFEKNGVICRLSVYCTEKKEWISKENGSPETDIESFKGGISGAFKRVASSGYGIGRYLYELDTTFAECSTTKQNGYKQAKTKDNQYLYWKVPNGSNATKASTTQSESQKTEYKKVESRDNTQQPQKANKEEMSKDDIDKLKEQIHALCKQMSPDEKREAIKKASYYQAKTTGKESYIDDINDLKRGSYDAPSWQLQLTLKKLQEAMLSEVAAEFVSDPL